MKKNVKSRAMSFALTCAMVVTMLLAFATLGPLQSFAAYDKPEEPHEACATAAVTIDWGQHKEELAEIKYSLRVSEEMLPEVETLVLTYLVSDGIVPSSTLSEHAAFENTAVLERFIAENVNVDVVYGAFCCDNMQRRWIGVCDKYTEKDGKCVRHCLHEAYRCDNCKAVWDFRHTITAPNGCGKSIDACIVQQHGYGTCKE